MTMNEECNEKKRVCAWRFDCLESMHAMANPNIDGLAAAAAALTISIDWPNQRAEPRANFLRKLCCTLTKSSNG